MEILLIIAYSSLFIFLICRLPFFRTSGISAPALSFLFVLKLFFGFSLWAIYTFYYPNRATADIYKYFDDSEVIFNALKTKPLDYFKMLLGIGNDTPAFDEYYSKMHYWARKNSLGSYNDGHTVIRFNAFIRLFSLGFYTVHTVFICFISFIGLTAIYKVFLPFLKNKKKELLFAVFLLPSVLFWGSGVLKEGLLFFTLGLFLYYFQRPFNWKTFFMCSVMGVLTAVSKFYVWLAISPGLFFLFIIRKTGTQKLLLKYTVVILSTVIIGTTIDRYTTIQNPLVTLTQKQIEFNSLATGQNQDANHQNIPAAGSRISIPPLQPTLTSFLQNAPIALWNVFVRPYPTEMKSAMMLPVGVENLFTFVIAALCLIYRLPYSEIKWEYVLFCFSFVIIQFLIIGETTPVLGAIARYKVPALPFLVIGFLLMLDKEKIVKKMPVLQKIFGNDVLNPKQ